MMTLSWEDSRRMEKTPEAMGGLGGYQVGPIGPTIAPTGAPLRVWAPSSGSFLHRLS